MSKFDFLKITSANRLYNLHTHTQFCDGRSSIEEFCDAAERLGFTHLGFSPHSPLPIDSPCNMDVEDVPAYIETVRRMRELHPSLHIYTSMEVDYLSDDWGPATTCLDTLPLDYRIGSVHFIPDLDGKFVDIDGSEERFRTTLETRFDGDLRTLVNTFFNQSAQMIRTGGFDMIGHFDKIAQNASSVDPEIENSPWYRKRLSDLTEMIIESGVAVELNTKIYNKNGRLFPNRNILNRLTDAGVTIVVNSDAHYADRLNAGRDEAFAILEAASRAEAV